MPIHPLWIVAILVIVLIIFGPGRLPELGAGIGKAMREFRKATSELTTEVTNATQPVATPPAPAPTPAAPAPTESTPAQGSESASPSQR